jgi:hypothetical protein
MARIVAPMEDAVHSYRRMATAAVLGAVVAAALSSCGIKPEAAAVVDSTVITEKQVDQVIGSIHQANVPRVQIVQDMVLSTACKAYAADHGISYDTSQAAAQWEQQGVPTGEYLQVLAQRSACLSAVAGGPGVQPSEEELQKVYQDVNKLQPGVLGSYEEAKPRLLQEPAITGAFAAKHVAAGADVSVNPRYRTLTVPLVNLGQDVVMQIELGEPANAAVSDAPKPPAPTSLPNQPGQPSQPTS